MFLKIKPFFAKIFKKLPVLIFDLVAIPLAWYFAYWLRYNMAAIPPGLMSHDSLLAIAILITIQTACYYYFKVYRGLWRFSSVDDVVRIIKAVLSAIVLSLPVFYALSLLHAIPRSILPLYAIALVSFLSGGRLILRNYQRPVQHTEPSLASRVLIIGAGEAGESLVRDLKRSASFYPIGYVDDNIRKKDMDIHGVRVLGQSQDLVALVQKYAIDLIFIAIPSASSAAMRRIVNVCEQTKIPFRTLPSLKDLASGFVAINALREVSLEDLLGRDEVYLEWAKIGNAINNARVLVTGGGGSIGSELCRQIALLGPEKLMIIDNSDYNLYQIEMELREHMPSQNMDFVLASIMDRVAMEDCFATFKPTHVFHAAAYKHVPMLEHQIRVAALNNIIGTQIVAEQAIAADVEKFILISTDKAVNPTNVMGTTKRIAEIYCQNSNTRAQTQFITVRFGNVLGSAGSVIPLFKKQLQAGGPLTVTHPDIERYFMTIPEAARLILQAMVNGFGGEIFVLDMGLPVKISYLAEQLIRLAGKEPGRDIAIKYTGLRPGEKLFEELFHVAEALTPTAHEKLFKAAVRTLDWAELNAIIQELEGACKCNNTEHIEKLFKKLVPEYKKEVVLGSKVEAELESEIG